MASRRKLKKNVNYIISDLYRECMFQTLLKPEIKEESIDEIVGEVFDIKVEFVSRISHTEPGNVKGFYKKFKEDFSKAVSDLIAKLSSLN